MEEVTAILLTIQKDLLEQKENMKTMETNITININKHIDQKFNELEQEHRKLELQVQEQERRIDQLERQSKRKNVVLFGVEETELNYQHLVDIVLNIFNKDIKILCEISEIEFIKRIGRKGTNPRPISVTLSTLGKKIVLLQSKKNLDITNYYLKEDFPPKVLQIRKTLQEEVANYEAEGIKAIIKYDKIIVLEKNKRQKSMRPSEQTPHKNQKRYLSLTPEENRYRNKTASLPIHKKNKPNIKSFFAPTKDPYQTHKVQDSAGTSQLKQANQGST